MWTKDMFEGSECALVAAQLEEAASRMAPGFGADELRSALSTEAGTHLAQCAECENSIEEMAESVRLLAAVERGEGPSNPFFVKRVMAAIATAEAEQERTGRIWQLVPKLAAKLAGAAGVALLIVAMWVYNNPNQGPVKQQPADSGTQLFEDNSTVPSSQDDVLMSLLERPE